MIQIINQSTDPALNLAVEEYFLKRVDLREDLLLLWRNEPTIVIGKNQNIYQELNLDYVKVHGIQAVRRLSGGGAVYHDLGNLNFTVIKTDFSLQKNDFTCFLSPVVKGLRAMGVPVSFSGRNDLMADGKKISGNAQYFWRDRILHHGTLLFDSDLTALSCALKSKPEKFTAKGVTSVRNRVGMISSFLPFEMKIEQFQERIAISYQQEYASEFKRREILPKEWLEIEKLAEEKYRTWEWTYGALLDMDLWNEMRFEGGLISLYVQIKEAKISKIRFQGDFFELQPVSDLEKQFRKIPWKKEAVHKRIQEIECEKYIRQLTSKDLLRLFADIPL